MKLAANDNKAEFHAALDRVVATTVYRLNRPLRELSVRNFEIPKAGCPLLRPERQ